jgi:hypothetical protein
MASLHPSGFARVGLVGRLGFRAAAIAPPATFIVSAALGALAACTSPLQTPPQIGDCTPSAGITCSVGSPGGGIELPVDGGSVDGSGEIISESLDGGSCGPVDRLLVSDCASCVIQNCCQSDSYCSNDDGCYASVQCAAANMSCPTLSPTSQTDLDDFLQCVDLYCASPCLTVATHDF